MTNAERQKRHREKLKALRDAHDVTKSGGIVTDSPQSVTRPSNMVTSVTQWDKVKYPEKEAWEIATERVTRAKRYAEMFPQFVRSPDLIFQDLDWQYHNEGLPAVKNPNKAEKEK